MVHDQVRTGATTVGSARRSAAPDSRPSPLTALRHPLVSRALDDADLLTDLADGLGSPLHVLLPEVVEQNVARMRAELGGDATILFAKKANKAACFAQAAATSGIGVDVASGPELVAALAAGVPGVRIGVSGPEKDDALHQLALAHGCLVAVDSASELRRLGALARARRTAVRVLLRSRVATQPHSRFGMTDPELTDALGVARDTGFVEVEGFSFHLDGYRPQDRARAAHDLVDRCVGAQAMGLTRCRTVNLGGGLPVRYVDPQQWAEFAAADRPDHYHARKEFDGCYPYGTRRPWDLALRDIMEHPDAAGESLRARGRGLGIRFLLEPGRALLDQAGFTVFRVQAVAPRPGEGYAIVTVAGSSFSLSEQWFGSEYLPEPVLLRPGRAAAQYPACVAGSTCLENDLLTWRKIGFPRPVVPGDHLVYLNTAGYQMDANESPFHDLALPRKVVLRLDRPGRPRWHLDDVPPCFDHRKDVPA